MDISADKVSKILEQRQKRLEYQRQYRLSHKEYYARKQKEYRQQQKLKNQDSNTNEGFKDKRG